MPKRIISDDVAVLLRKCDLGAICGHHADGQWTVFHGLTANTVADAITPLETAGLVERGEWLGGNVFPRRPYRLTDAGRAELNRYVRRLARSVLPAGAGA